MTAGTDVHRARKPADFAQELAALAKLLLAVRAEYPPLGLIPRLVPGGIRGSATPCGRGGRAALSPPPYLTPQQKLAVLISHLHGKYANKVKAGVLEAL